MFCYRYCTCYVLYVQYMIVHKVVVFHHAIVRWSFSFSQHTYIRASYVVGQSTVCSIGKYITDDVQTAKTCISMSSSDILNVPSFDNITSTSTSISDLFTGTVHDGTTVQFCISYWSRNEKYYSTTTTVFSHCWLFVACSQPPARQGNKSRSTNTNKVDILQDDGWLLH